jgi:hypothetical protein
MCNINYSVISCQRFTLIYIYIWLFYCTQDGGVGVCVYFTFRCWIYISCVCVERNITVCYAYHSTRKCVIHMYETIAVCNGRHVQTLLRLGLHDAGQGKRRAIFQISTECSKVLWRHPHGKHATETAHLRAPNSITTDQQKRQPTNQSSNRGRTLAWSASYRPSVCWPFLRWTHSWAQ